MNFQAMSRQRKFLLITAAAGIISIFLPWHTAGGIFQGININGFHGIGVLVFFLFTGTAVLSLIGDQTKPLDKTIWLITMAAGAIAALCVVVRLSGAGDVFGIMKPGIGVFLAMAVSIGIVAFAWLYKNPGDTLQNAFDSLKGSIGSSTAGATPPPPTGSNKIDELEKLIELKNQGKISDEEYQSLKSKMM